MKAHALVVFTEKLLPQVSSKSTTLTKRGWRHIIHASSNHDNLDNHGTTHFYIGEKQ